MEFLALAERIATLSVPVLLVLIILGIIFGWWVPRWLYDRESLRADVWKELYDRERTYNNQNSSPNDDKREKGAR